VAFAGRTSPPYSGRLYFKLTGVAQGFELA
jgi:hypothetical protein